MHVDFEQKKPNSGALDAPHVPSVISCAVIRRTTSSDKILKREVFKVREPTGDLCADEVFFYILRFDVKIRR